MQGLSIPKPAALLAHLHRSIDRGRSLRCALHVICLLAAHALEGGVLVARAAPAEHLGRRGRRQGREDEQERASHFLFRKPMGFSNRAGRNL